MMLGNVCTRRCGFCAVQKGAPLPVDYDEPNRVAEAVAALGLRFAVITSVNRDDREDGGAEIFAMVIRAIRERVPGCGVEVLVPDFQGSHAAMETVMEAAPDVFNHNTETVPRLYRQVRLGARYERSLDVLAHAKRWRRDSHEIRGDAGAGRAGRRSARGDARFAGAQRGYSDAGTILRPSPKHLPIVRYVPPEEFDELKRRGLRNGLRARGIGSAGAEFVPRGMKRGACRSEFAVCRQSHVQ
jgi:lipoyl synthase